MPRSPFPRLSFSARPPAGGAKAEELRSLVWTRKQPSREQTRHTQRIEKTLEKANIKLDPEAANTALFLSPSQNGAASFNGWLPAAGAVCVACLGPAISVNMVTAA